MGFGKLRIRGGRGGINTATQPVPTDRVAGAGDGQLGMPRLVTDATAGAYTITTDAILMGGVKRNGGAGDRVDTLPTGAVIEAAFPQWDINEVRMMLYSNIGTSNKLTITTAASGTTVLGNVAVLAKTAIWIHIKKTAASTFTFNCL